MSTQTSGDVSLVQDEDLLRKMWQETEDFGKKKEIRSHMYKIREARLKDFYNAGEETAGSSESRQHTTTTKTTSSSTGLKGSDLMTHADNLADHSFLSLKSKEIRDSESPTKDSYKITEMRNINDRDWNVVECNKSSKDGKTHTTSRVATTSGKQNVDGGEMKYAAKSEQQASVFKDGDDKNFTKSVGASSQNVISQEAFGGDDNKFYSTSTTTSSSSKFSSEQRSATDDSADMNLRNSKRITDTGDRSQKIIIQEDRPSGSTHSVVRKVYTEDIPNELKTHPSYIDGNTKVTTETKTLPDGSTVTTTRYETKGATHQSSSSSTTSSATRHVSSNQQTSSNSSKRYVTEDSGKHLDNRNVNIVRDSRIHDTNDATNTVVRNQNLDSKSFVDNKNDSSRIVRQEFVEKRYVDESDVKRINDMSLIGRDVKNVENIDVVVKSRDVPVRETHTVTVTKNVGSTFDDRDVRDRSDVQNINTVIKSHHVVPRQETQTVTKVTKNINTTYDNQQFVSDDFLNTERRHVVESKTSTNKIEDTPLGPSAPKQKPSEFVEIEFITTNEQPRRQEPREPRQKPSEIVEIEFTIPKEQPKMEEPKYEQPERRQPIKPAKSEWDERPLPAQEPKKEEPKYEQPERRKPIKPGKSEWDDKPSPTDGQYDTTYRTDYVPRRISVEVSPTHDAFARSLRSISPDRVSKTGSVRSLRTTSTTSLRSSPDRHFKRRPSPVGSTSSSSPTKKTSKSPEKYITTETVPKRRNESPEKMSPEHITKSQTNTDTITRKKKTTTAKTETDSSTLTKKKPVNEQPRSRSVSPTSTASDIEFIRHRSDIVTDLDVDETNRRNFDDTKFLRRHTEDFDQRPSSLDVTKKPQKVTEKSSTTPLTEFKKSPLSPTKDTHPTRKDVSKPRSPSKEPVESKPRPKSIRRTDTYEERCKEILGIGDGKDARKPSLPNAQSPTKSKKGPEPKEFPSQTRKSPQKEPLEPYSGKPKTTKQTPSVQEFPSQIRRSSEKEPLEPYPDKQKMTKKTPSVQEFPSQVRRSPEKLPSEAYPEKSKPTKQQPSVQEFPAQIRKSPVKEPLEPYPEKTKGSKQQPSVQEFPSQIRKSPEKEPLEPYPEKQKSSRQQPSTQEFPSQIRKPVEKEPLEPYPEKAKTTKQAPSIQEFPSQIKRTPEKEPLEPYPERPKHTKQEPSTQEFPSQIRKSQEREPMEPYPEKQKPTKQDPSLQEFPSHIRKAPGKEPLEPYPEKQKPTKEAPHIQEFPSQIKISPRKEPLEPYPEKPKGTKQEPSVQEFPSQIRQSPGKEPLEPYPEKTKYPKQQPTVQEFPGQIRKSPEKQPLEPYPEKSKPTKQQPSVQEFPGQIRKSPEKQTLEPYPEKPKVTKQAPSVQEFSSQTKKQPVEPSPQQTQPTEEYPCYYEPYFDQPLEKSSNKVSLDDLPSVKTDKVSLDDIPRVQERDRKAPRKISLSDLDYKEDKDVDSFINNEKFDTEITLKKYKDDTVRGISDTKVTKNKSKSTTKTKKSKTTTMEDDSETTTDEEEEIDEVEDQIIEDVYDLVESVDRKVSDKYKEETLIDVKDIEKKVTQDKKPKDRIQKPRPEEPQIEDFVTVTKAQLLQSVSKNPVEEQFHTKKFMTTLCKEDEEDRLAQITLTEKECKINIPVVGEAPKPIKSIKKDTPDKKISTITKTLDKKKQAELLIKKEKQDTNIKTVVETKKVPLKTVPKEPIKKTPEVSPVKSQQVKKPTITRKTTEDKKTYETEYTDQYCVTVKDKKKIPSRVSTKITLAPVKQTPRIPNGVPTRPNLIEKKPISKQPGSPDKKPDDQQPKQPSKLRVTEIRQPRFTAKTTVQKTVEIQPARRHVVSTIINIKPKPKPETKTIHKTTATKTITVPRTTKISPTKLKQKPSQNGHISTDEDESDVEVIKYTEEVPVKETLKPRSHGIPTRRSPYTKTVDASDRTKKCITTKSILIENAVADQREIIVDLKRSKSSREGTPDRICPYPVPGDVDQGTPRYPDRVTEPEDGSYRPKPKRISDIPLSETERVTDFDRVTEVTEGTRRTARTEVESTDECLLSVNEKVSKFLSTAEQVTKKPLDVKPPPKVERPRLEVDDALKEDECLLSVSDKVQKFITTAEQLATGTKEIQVTKTPKYKDEEERVVPLKKQPEEIVPKTKELRRDTYQDTTETEQRIYSRKSTSPEKRYSPEKRESPEKRVSPEKRDSPLRSSPKRSEADYKTPERRSSDLHTTKTTEELAKIRKESFVDDDTPKTSRRVSKDEPKTIISPTGRLRSTETIKRAKALFENIGKDRDMARQKDILSRPSVFEGRNLKKTEETSVEKRSKDVRTRLTYDEVKRSPSPDKPLIKSRDDSPNKEIPHYMTPLECVVKPKKERKDSLEPDDIDSIGSRDDSPNREIPHYMTPLERMVKPKKERKHSVETDEIESIRSRDESPNKEIPHYMTPLDRMVKPKRERKHSAETDDIDSIRSRDSSPDGDIPHYMLPLDRTLRERSPHKENLRELGDIMNRSTDTEEVEVKTTKFGVSLRRTDSGRNITTTRKSSTASVDKQTTELDIEEIYDLQYLEKLLETIVGYDIRRRIRAQIRLIKRSNQENTCEIITTKRTSPAKDRPRPSVDKFDESTQVKRHTSSERRRQSEEYTSQHDTRVSEVSEYQSSYSRRKISSEISAKVKSPSPEGRRPITSKSLKDKSRSPDRKPSATETDSVETKSTTTTTTRLFQTDLKKTKPLTKTLSEDKPEWITQRSLRKVSETTAPVKKTVTTTMKKVTTKKEKKDVKPTDVITSSYGVGPTDENGTPLFGLKALRAQNKSEKTKVQGTVIRSHYYSENGGEPEGEVSVTKFSTDPSDLGTENVSRDKGITSMTTTQKFGYKDTPSLKTISSKNKKTSQDDTEYKSTVKSSKVTRRGSVKEISQKFIENAVDTLKSERQSSYPKAGLILRTSSFKDTASDGTGSSREGSPAMQEVRQQVVTSVKRTSTTSDGKKADTFLTNKSRVTGVQDVISRMKNEDVEIEESEEDTEARNLLNKFIGSQVLLSGMESHTSKPVTSTTGSTKRTTKITTTTTSSESSKPTTVTRTFTHPITAELLETVWEEQTLKLLLEQSTDYEDRRIIRARLREVMAEQEACAELVEKASSEATMKEPAGTVHGTATRTSTEAPITTTSQFSTRITSQQQVKKPMSPFAKFRQLDKQNSLNSPPSTPKSPSGGGPLFKFTDPSLTQSANTVKQRLLQWCQMKTKEYENIQLDNFSTSWSDGMAFCALIHHFLPDSFDYKILNPRNRRRNFTLAFQVADEKAGIAPLLDVDDMVAISKPDWKCVFTYVQSIYRRFKDED